MVETKILSSLALPHQKALNWFAARTGEEISWPEPLEGDFYLLNKAKGIHKPKGWKHALSVRQAINSPYADKEIIFSDDGRWTFDYFQEGEDPTTWEKDFTNRALMQNIEDGVPVAVVRQTKLKPHPRYHVMGLARVTGWHDGYFRLESFDSAETSPLLTSAAPSAVDLNDARRRIERSIVQREGAGKFRSNALQAFQGRCAISDCNVGQVLEAAHIVPYLGAHTNGIGNTLLLRADLHTLFDKGLLSIDVSNLTVKIGATISGTEYKAFHGQPLKLPPGDKSFWKASLKLRSEILPKVVPDS